MNASNPTTILARRALALFLPALLATPLCLAADWRPGGAFAEAGFAARGTHAATAGLVWPWDWRRPALGGELSGTTELFLSQWSARDVAGRQGFTQIGLVPLFRLRLDAGRSPWFVEGGIGISLLDEIYRTPTKNFSTTGNFYDVAALGRSVDDARRQELSLRLTHISNASVKRPNPGENFLQLRYAMRF